MLATAAMAVLVAGCNQSNTSGPNGAASTEATNTVAPTPGTGTSYGGGTNLTAPVPNSDPAASAETDTTTTVRNKTTTTMDNLKEDAANLWEKSKNATTNAAMETWTDIQDTLSSTENYSYDKKAEYVTRAQADLAALDQKIDGLTNRLVNASDNVKTGAQPQIDNVRSQRSDLDKKLDDVRNATPSDWDEAKKAFKDSYDQAKASVKQAWKQVSAATGP